MNKIILSLTFAAFLLMGCNKSSNANNNASNASLQSNKEAKGTQQLTRQMFLDNIWDFTTDSEEFKFKGDKPVLIDFYADWCGPCKMVAPILEELAVEYHGKIHIYKVNTEKERQLASEFGIQSIPSFLIIPKEGKPMMHSGAGDKAMFKQIIEEAMLGNKPAVQQ